MKEVIVIGDSTNNTLSVIRSLGEKKVPQILILKGKQDNCNVCKSKYLKDSNIFKIENISEAKSILYNIESNNQLIITTFDEAAMWVDENEPILSQKFITPCRGNRIGNLFNKEAQCQLAINCGLTIPKSIVYSRGDNFDFDGFGFPLLLKPLVSTIGEKSDIHICKNINDVKSALTADSSCSQFVVQEFIEKVYELDCVGLSTDDEVIISGAIRKIRHYPPLTGAGAYGEFIPISQTNIDVQGVTEFIRQSNYHGPFSVEFLHTADGKEYFMEVNFRNEGLAYASTIAGANLHAIYAEADKYSPEKVKNCFMMNYSLDFLYVKSGDISLKTWLRDFVRTKCFINFSRRDPMPTISYYLSKFRRK